MTVRSGSADARRSFLRRYNPSGTAEEAFARSVTAASQRNALYRPEARVARRRQVRAGWESRLREVTRAYAHAAISETQYERDVLELRDYMNEHFGDAFRCYPHPRFRYEPGFRISHAQKSLSVALKHLWCMGEAAAPPQCPVDSIALRAAGVRYPGNRWTHVNTIEEHRALVERLRTAADKASLDLAEWELSVFPA